MAERMDDNGHGSPVHRFPDADYISPMKEHPDWRQRRSGERIDAWLDRLSRGFQ